MHRYLWGLPNDKQIRISGEGVSKVSRERRNSKNKGIDVVDLSEDSVETEIIARYKSREIYPRWCKELSSSSSLRQTSRRFFGMSFMSAKSSLSLFLDIRDAPVSKPVWNRNARAANFNPVARNIRKICNFSRAKKFADFLFSKSSWISLDRFVSYVCWSTYRAGDIDQEM